MRALILDGNEKAHVETVPDPVPGPGEVLVAMRCSGICGSDLVFYHRSPETLERQGNRIPCHEPSGVVVETGPGVRKVKAGDRVTVYHYVGCGDCRECRRGQIQWCHVTRGLGGAYQGSAADLLVVPERNAIPMPDELSYVDGAFIACGAGTTWSALNKINLTNQDTIAVFGLGPVGLCGVAIASAFGAKVIAVGRRKPRLEAARLLGATEVIDIDAVEKPAREIWNRPGARPRYIYETSSNPKAREWAVAVCDRGGEIVSVGAMGEPGWPAAALVGKELTLHGSFVIRDYMVFDLMRFLVANRVNLGAMVTHRFSIEDSPKAFELFNGKDCGKVVIEWPDA